MSLLIITDSRDYTTDLIIRKLDHVADQVFRFNLDLIRDYRLEASPTRFRIVDPLGRVTDSHGITKLYWRKPVARSQHGAEAAFFEAELWQLVKSFVRLCWEENKIVLVEPLSESSRLDKLRQLRIAQKYFEIPLTSVVRGQRASELANEVVVKSLSGETVGNKRLYTKRVDQDDLSSEHIWFMQSTISARYDLTVVCVQERQFAFKFDREALGLEVDWRSDVHNHQMCLWQPVALPTVIGKQISAFMLASGLHFGRLDFLWDGAEPPTFCEVNPNGQFAWLDLDGSRGVLEAVVEAVDPSTKVVPIPTPIHPAGM